MDANDAPSHQPGAPAPKGTAARTPGGIVEPVNRLRIAKDRLQSLLGSESLRYEMRDPFAEVTYRSASFPEMVTHANKLGSGRFFEIDAQQRRTAIEKVNGRWEKITPKERDPDSPQKSPKPAEHDRKGHPGAPTLPSAAGRSPVDKPLDSSSPSTSIKSQAPDLKAERIALIRRLEANLAERYVIKRAPVTLGDITIGNTEYRFRGDTSRIAFTESTFRLATDTNSPSVARSMVDVAQARNWKSLRISGNEEFKRLVWLEANTRGVKALGYEPTAADLELVKREREARMTNRVEPDRSRATPRVETPSSVSSPRDTERGSGGRKAVLAAIEAVLVAKGVPEARREAVMTAAAEKLEQRIRAGRAPAVKVYDQSAPSQSASSARKPTKERTRDRSQPIR